MRNTTSSVISTWLSHAGSLKALSIENLDKVVPGIAHPDNLVYAPEIKFYSNALNNQAFKGLKFIGDCSGFTRSIIYATAHGYVMGESLLEEFQ